MNFFKNNLTRLLCAFLFVILIFTQAAGVAEAADGGYDFSRPASSHNVTLSSDAILAAYLGTQLSEAEADYLRDYGGITLTYNDGITTDKIVREYSDGTLTVTAYEYSYTAVNGAHLTWRPVSVTVGSREISLVSSGGGYTAELTGIPEDDALLAFVNYRLSLTVAREDISSLVNRAYLDAPVWERTLEEREREYEESLAKYNADRALYEEYLARAEQYERELELYRSYLIEKKLYDDALLEYNEYLSALDKYELDLAAYNNYEAALAAYNAAYAEYLEYCTALADYNAKLEVYNEQQAKLATVRAQLGIVDTAKVKMTMSRDVYSAIMGNLVTEVLVGNKDLLTSPAIGAKAEVIEAAETATENLRILLPTYFSLASEEERYAYYSANFTQLCDNFKSLAQALDELYRNRRIRNELKAQDRDEKYAILVAQLSLIAGALNGGTVDSYYGTEKLGGSYTIDYGGTQKTFSAILENKQYIDTGVFSTPLAGGYPSVTDEPTAPVEKPVPTAPETVKEPVRPSEVTHPGTAPATVSEPIEPSPVPEPVRPVEYVPEPSVVKLIESYTSGELSEREEPEEDFTFNVHKTVTKKLFGVTEVTVVFHGTDGAVLETVSVDSGTGVEFSGTHPSKAEDARAVYTFRGWRRADGELADLTSVGDDLDLYPYFSESLKLYDVTFNVDGITTVKSFAYGTVPDFGGTPSRPDSDSFRYSFSGWDKPLAPVVGDAAYSACFDREYIVPFGASGATLTSDDRNYTVNVRSAGTSKIDLTYLIEKALTPGAVRGITLDTAYGRVSLSYSTISLMHAAGDTVLSVRAVQLGAYGYSYNVSVYNQNGTPASAGYKLSARFVCGLSDSSGNSLFYLSDGKRVGVSYTHDGSLVAFSALSGVEYSIIREYSVNVVPSETAVLTVSSGLAHGGDVVSVSVAPVTGYKIVSLRVTDKDGAAVTATGGTFVMPHSDVTVAVETAPIEYTVTFMDGTRTLAVRTYKHGEIPTPPTAPSKLGEGYYLYTFSGWSRELLPVDSSVTYYAVYTVTPLPEPKEPEGLQISEGILKLIIAAAVALAMLTFVVIPSLIVNVCIYVRYRRQKLKHRWKG
ncbi:MAG: InlB B-repeat-containing protein [Clostridia bacterium]|nr:InlB B-repeat-containing protein [Clostridia bacterium]